MKKKKIINITTLIVIILFLISCILFIDKQIKADAIKKEIDNSIIKVAKQDINIEDEINNLKQNYNNTEIIGILSIGNEISTPITQTTNNNFYLYNSLTKENSVMGTTFLDSRHDVITSKQLNIYGHNSNEYDPPFKTLQNYLNQDFYKNNLIIELRINNEIRIYEIFSIAIVDKTEKAEHMQFSYATDEEWLEHFNRLKNISLHKSNLVLEKQDKIIVLQTCLFGKYNGKFLIVSGKQIQI